MKVGVSPGSPKVSVIVPVHNCAAYLTEAIASVLRQTWQELELIVVDDGSTDDFSTAVAAFAQDPRLTVLRQPHAGISSARNAGLRRAGGEMIAFLDADDRWPRPGQLAEQIAYLDAHGEFGMVFGDAQPFDGCGPRGRPYLLSAGYYPASGERPVAFPLSMKLLCTGGFFLPTGTIVLRRACLDRVGLFDESLRMFEDVDLWLRIGRHYQIAFFPKVMLDRREHGTNAGHRRFLFMDDFLRFLEKHDAAAQGVSPRSYAARAHIEAARYHLASGDLSAARRALRHSMRSRVLPQQLAYLALTMLQGSPYRMLRRVKHALRPATEGR